MLALRLRRDERIILTDGENILATITPQDDAHNARVCFDVSRHITITRQPCTDNGTEALQNVNRRP